MRRKSSNPSIEYRNLVSITDPITMANKKSFVLRIDEEVYKAMEKWASDDFRSVNGQIEWLINQQLKASGRLKTKDESHSKSDKKK